MFFAVVCRVRCRRPLSCAVVFSVLLCGVVVRAVFSLCLLGSAHLQVCAPWCSPPPGLCVVPSAGVLRLGALCCAFLLCATVGCFVPSGVRWLCAGRHCCLLLCVLRRLWAWCLVALCCAVLPVACCFVLVALLCAVLCLLVLCWAVWRRVVLYGAALLCTVLWGWCCSALSRVPLRAVVCPRVLCGASGAVCFAACCAVLCCAAVFCPVPWGVVSWCAVLCCSCCVLLFGRGLCSCVLCCVSWCCAALRCVVLSHEVQCCCALCCLRGVVLFLLSPFWCCCVLCPVFGCCAVLWGAVPFGAAFCCVALCCVRCAVCVLPLHCGVCCLLLLSVVLLAPCGVALCARLPLCIFKNRKAVACQHVLCPVVSCRVLPALPASNNTKTKNASLLFFLILRLPAPVFCPPVDTS